MNKKCIVFCAPHKAALNEMLSVAENLPEGFVAIFLIEKMLPSYKFILDSGFKVFSKTAFNSTIENKRRNRFSSWVKETTKQFVDNSFVGVFLQSVLFKGYLVNRTLRKLELDYAWCDGVLSKYKVNTLVISNDRSIGLEAVLSKWAKEKSARIVIPPIAYASDKQGASRLRLSKVYEGRSHHENTAVVSIGGSDRLFLFYRPFEREALARFGALSNNPWVLGEGLSDILMVESERERQRLINCGASKNKILLTGHMSHDALWQMRQHRGDKKKQLRQEYDLNHDNIIVVALPQYWEHQLCDRQTHFQYIERMCEVLEEQGNALLSLHPKMDRFNYEYLEQKYKVQIANEPLKGLIGGADLFVATYSSTVAWALMLKVPTIIVDFIKLNYSGFYDEFDIPIVKEVGDLKNKLNLSIEASMKRPDKLIKTLSPYDGKCSSRIVNAVIS